MKITKRQLKRIIKEEKLKLLREITPGAAGQAAMGGLTPADQGFAAARADDAGILNSDYIVDLMYDDLYDITQTGAMPEETWKRFESAVSYAMQQLKMEFMGQ